jgi:hypothetical protein
MIPLLSTKYEPREGHGEQLLLDFDQAYDDIRFVRNFEAIPGFS